MVLGFLSKLPKEEVSRDLVTLSPRTQPFQLRVTTTHPHFIPIHLFIFNTYIYHYIGVACHGSY